MPERERIRDNWSVALTREPSEHLGGEQLMELLASRLWADLMRYGYLGDGRDWGDLSVDEKDEFVCALTGWTISSRFDLLDALTETR